MGTSRVCQSLQIVNKHVCKNIKTVKKLKATMNRNFNKTNKKTNVFELVKKAEILQWIKKH